MSVVIGSYKNKSDRDAKMNAYKKMLIARQRINQLSESAFKDKSVRGDAPYIPSPVETKLYDTTEEELADLNSQEQKAIQLVKTVLPKRNDAVVWVLQTLNPRGITTDPLSPAGARANLSNVQLLNKYWGRFQNEDLKGLQNLGSAQLKNLWDEFLEGLSEDLLPKQSVIDSINGLLDTLSARLGAPTAEITALKAELRNRTFTERQLKTIEKSLLTNLTNDTVRSFVGIAPPLGAVVPAAPPAPPVAPIGAPPKPMGTPRAPIPPAAPKAPAGKVPAPVGSKVPAGKAPAVLRWRLTIPVENLNVDELREVVRVVEGLKGLPSNKFTKAQLLTRLTDKGIDTTKAYV